VTSALDSDAQTALLTLGKTGFLASLDLTVHVYETLQRLKVFVVKKGYVCFVLKNLCHILSFYDGCRPGASFVVCK
jgi:hypothetical protein